MKAYKEVNKDGDKNGSNSKLVSLELATLLSGRYIEINVLPLTFSEFLIFREQENRTDTDYEEFPKCGGMPGIHYINWETRFIYEYLNSIFDTIVLKDIIQRYNIRNVAFLQKIILFIFDNVSQIFSVKRVVDFLKKQNRRTNIEKFVTI